MAPSRGNLIMLVLASILLVASLFFVVYSFRIPISKEKEVSRVSYQIASQVTQQAYGTPVDWTLKTDPVYFRNIIDLITVHYNYEFVAGNTASSLIEGVEISAVLEGEELWQKEIILVPRREYTGNVSITFPLNLEELDRIMADISNELGIMPSGPSGKYRIRSIDSSSLPAPCQILAYAMILPF